MENIRQVSQINKAHDIVYISIFVAFIAICSWIAIPATVPFTLQTMAVFTTIGFLGGKRGTLAVLVYILLGAIGLPVFAGFSGGIGTILGTSGGYIVGSLFSALVMWIIEKFFGRSSFVLAMSMIIGLIVCYGFGTIWFMTVYMQTVGVVELSVVLGWCVIPFIIPDLIKIGIALFLVNRLEKVLP